MTTGYSLRNTPTLLERIDMFNINRPARRSFNAWVEDLQKLSGVRDVSQEDAQVQEAFASDPQYADEYAAAECADGLAREHDMDEIRE
jgi:hypothetical protein